MVQVKLEFLEHQNIMQYIKHTYAVTTSISIDHFSTFQSLHF
jgi:hypothetical protein